MPANGVTVLLEQVTNSLEPSRSDRRPKCILPTVLLCRRIERTSSASQEKAAATSSLVAEWWFSRWSRRTFEVSSASSIRDLLRRTLTRHQLRNSRSTVTMSSRSTTEHRLRGTTNLSSLTSSSSSSRLQNPRVEFRVSSCSNFYSMK